MSLFSSNVRRTLNNLLVIFLLMHVIMFCNLCECILVLYKNKQVKRDGYSYLLFATANCPPGKYAKGSACTGKYIFAYELKTLSLYNYKLYCHSSVILIV